MEGDKRRVTADHPRLLDARPEMRRTAGLVKLVTDGPQE